MTGQQQTFRTPAVQRQKVYKSVVLGDDEVRVLQYILRHCEGDVVNKLKSKLATLNFNIR